MRQDGLDGVGVDSFNDSRSGSDRSILDTGYLVANSAQDKRKQSNEVGLNVGRNLGVLGNILDGDGGLLTGEGILLVGDLLLQTLDSPRRSPR